MNLLSLWSKHPGGKHFDIKRCNLTTCQIDRSCCADCWSPSRSTLLSPFPPLSRFSPTWNTQGEGWDENNVNLPHLSCSFIGRARANTWIFWPDSRALVERAKQCQMFWIAYITNLDLGTLTTLLLLWNPHLFPLEYSYCSDSRQLWDWRPVLVGVVIEVSQEKDRASIKFVHCWKKLIFISLGSLNNAVQIIHTCNIGF